MIRHFIRWPVNWLSCANSCALLQKSFLIVAVIGLAGQIAYDKHAITVVSLFPQWFLLASIWYLSRPAVNSQYNWARGTLLFALLIPALSCMPLLVAWLGWKANSAAICGVIPISDAASYYISAQTFLRDAFLNIAGQRRPLNVILTSLWLYLSGDDFKLLLLVQALAFSAVAFFASAVVAAMHGFRAGLLLFAFFLVFAEPYLPTTMSETNGIIFGTLALVGVLFGLYRRSFGFYCFGAFFLAMGLAVRPSALLVLPCVVIAGSIMFGNGRIKALVVAAFLTCAVLLPSGISIVLNSTVSHRDGALNANLSYVVYGLVTGGKGWEQYQRDNPGKLDGLPEAEQSHVILEASRQYFTEHPLDLVWGLTKAQVLGPLQSFAQITRLAFLGAVGDPLKIVPPAAIIVISFWFAGVLLCQWISKRSVVSGNGDRRRFFNWILLGYLLSIPFFYKDGGLRIHAAMLPIISYLLVWALLPASSASENALLDANANRFLAGTSVFGFVLLGLLGWISIIHPKSRHFDLLPFPRISEAHKMVFRFEPGWPQCDLRNFERVLDDKRPRWFSGAIPDDNYRSEGIKDIAGQGNLYFGFDASTRDWKIVHTDKPIGLQNKIQISPGNRNGYRDNKYRDFFSAETVEVIGAN